MTISTDVSSVVLCFAVVSLPNSPVVSLKLDKTNYLIWHDQFLSSAIVYGLDTVLDLQSPIHVQFIYDELHHESIGVKQA